MFEKMQDKEGKKNGHVEEDPFGKRLLQRLDVEFMSAAVIYRGSEALKEI